jgi:coenzyme F420-reducing hydrogenase gamma subunit
MAEQKLKCAWFTFSCCEDNTIVMTELLNDHWLEWSKILEFKNFRALKTKNTMEPFDIAFIEGSIASQKQIDKLKQIRDLSKKLVAVGACAVVGMPSGQRDFFNVEQKQSIQPFLDQFAALPKVLKVSDIVKVDAEVPGCPMDPEDFVNKATALITELRK